MLVSRSEAKYTFGWHTTDVMTGCVIIALMYDGTPLQARASIVAVQFMPLSYI
jgi:hypothetical protein